MISSTLWGDESTSRQCQSLLIVSKFNFGDEGSLCNYLIIVSQPELKERGDWIISADAQRRQPAVRSVDLELLNSSHYFHWNMQRQLSSSDGCIPQLPLDHIKFHFV